MMDYVPTRNRRRPRYRYLTPNISLLADYGSAKCLQSRQDAAPTTDVKPKGHCGEKLNSGSGFPATNLCFFRNNCRCIIKKHRRRQSNIEKNIRLDFRALESHICVREKSLPSAVIGFTTHLIFADQRPS
jgi:hypothetical protein